jgi:hypothetical protein
MSFPYQEELLMLPKTDIWLLFVRIGDIGDTLHPTRSPRLGRKLLIDRKSITERDEFPYQEELLMLPKTDDWPSCGHGNTMPHIDWSPRELRIWGL